MRSRVAQGLGRDWPLATAEQLDHALSLLVAALKEGVRVDYAKPAAYDMLALLNMLQNLLLFIEHQASSPTSTYSAGSLETQVHGCCSRARILWSAVQRHQQATDSNTPPLSFEPDVSAQSLVAVQEALAGIQQEVEVGI